ncbi:hypothetical protein [Glycomyces dulcitolivorans]|uniref:hypothetical protein n=1 Tax=Glycomyces dulcitolivorans TaxID=2200759 RepID=UPI0013006954|nr:hypothetical protein [Glycomyces dulcitolivorans]
MDYCETCGWVPDLCACDEFCDVCGEYAYCSRTCTCAACLACVNCPNEADWDGTWCTPCSTEARQSSDIS